MLGETLKKAFSDARIPHQEAADKLGISKANLYNLFKKDSFEVDYLRRASEITGVPLINFFTQESTIVDQKSKTEGKNTGQDMTKMSRGIEELKAMFGEELREKNQQIAGLQRMLESVLGKFEGAALDQLSSGDPVFDGMMREYKAGMLGKVIPSPTIKSIPLVAKLVALSSPTQGTWSV